MPTISELQLGKFVGGGGQNYVYTYEEACTMTAAGTWRGGEIKGMGYIVGMYGLDEVTVTGSYRGVTKAYGQNIAYFEPTNQGRGNYYTYIQYMEAGQQGFGEYFLQSVLERVTAGVTTYHTGAYNNVRQMLETDILRAGYGPDRLIYSDRYQDRDGTIHFRIWDGRTGKLITSRAIMVPGYYY